jgi:N-formylglutamate deformylase
MDLPVPDPALCRVFALTRPARQAAPVVFVSAHSGTDYTDDFLCQSRLDPLSLRRSEDMFVDELFAAAPAHGAPLLCATFPRAFCDANREKWELDPAMFDGALPEYCNTSSLRVGAGLGTIARVVASGEAIYRGKLDFAAAALRMERCWQPFHDALEALVAQTRDRFGACLVVDCHSMPTVGTTRPPLAQVVLGDAHGTSCAPALMRLAEQCLQSAGLSVRRNDPYAGGYITRHYGRPREGIHALQIELARALYMDQIKLRKEPQAFAALRETMDTVVEGLVRQAAFMLGCARTALDDKKMAAP